jgi:hypothetical protein
MKACKEKRCVAPLIVNLSTRWRWVVNFTPRPLYAQEKEPQYLLNRRKSESFEENKNHLVAVPSTPSMYYEEEHVMAKSGNKVRVLYTNTFVLPAYYTISCLLYSLLHVSALKMSEIQGAASFEFCFGRKCWRDKYYGISLQTWARIGLWCLDYRFVTSRTSRTSRT